MQLSDYAGKVLALSECLYRWLGALSGLDAARRLKLAAYADEIAATLARAADAMIRMDSDSANPAARRQMVRELGRISGYVETMVGPLRHDLDGRKLAGVKRRLEQLSAGVLLQSDVPANDPAGIADLVEWARQFNPDRIVAEKRHGHWSAWFDGLRQVGFGPETPAQTVDRSVGFLKEPLTERNWSRAPFKTRIGKQCAYLNERKETRSWDAQGRSISSAKRISRILNGIAFATGSPHHPRDRLGDARRIRPASASKASCLYL